jgi:hypothetical protein
MIRFDNLPQEVMQAMCTPMHQILAPTPLPPTSHHPPRQSGALYLGSLTACLDHSLLHSHHITHLVQVLDVPWLPLSEKDGFQCYRIDIMDIATADLKPHLEGVCGYIDNALKRGESVLVHCQQVRLAGFFASRTCQKKNLIRSFIHGFCTKGRLTQSSRHHRLPHP